MKNNIKLLSFVFLLLGVLYLISLSCGRAVEPTTYSISGTIAGGTGGTIYIELYSGTSFEAVKFISTQETTGTSYAFSGLENRTYALRGFRDADADKTFDTTEYNYQWLAASPETITISNSNVTNNITLTALASNPATTYSISGSVSRGTSTNYNIIIWILTEPLGLGVNPVKTTSVLGPGPTNYLVSGLSNNTYYLLAFEDANGNIHLDQGEKMGIYGNIQGPQYTTVTINGSNATGKDISLNGTFTP